MKPALAVALVPLIALTSAGQTLSPGEVRFHSRLYIREPTISLETRLVQLEVVVRDSRGRVVTGLTRDDFSVYDSGKPRELTAFSADTSSPNRASSSSNSQAAAKTRTTDSAPAMQSSAPSAISANGRWIAVLFDDLNTPVGDLAHAKIASKRFVKEATASGDHIAVFTTSAGRSLEFTGDTAAILAAVATVQSHPGTAPGGLAQCPRITAYDAYRIVSNDPTVMKAKVSEACHCGGGPSCDVESLPDNEILSPRIGGAYGGAGTLSSVVDSVRAQAQQTWDQAHMASRATLDAVKSTLHELAPMPGRRMLLFASSGFLSGTLDEEQDAIVNEALRAGVVINSLDAKGLYAEAPGGPINESNELTEIPVSSTVFQIESLGDRLDSVDSALARFAESTGGLLFRNNNDLDLGFYRLGVLPECTYLLAFSPAEDGKYHRVKVKVKNARHEFTQVRPGYFAPGKASSMPTTSSRKIDAAVRGSDLLTDLLATDRESLKSTGLSTREVTIQMHVDLQRLTFLHQNNRHVEKLTFVNALFDLQGNFVTGKEADMELALKPETFELLSKSGINGVMSLDAPPGMYRLRVVVQEAVHGNMSATSKNIQIQ